MRHRVTGAAPLSESEKLKRLRQQPWMTHVPICDLSDAQDSSYSAVPLIGPGRSASTVEGAPPSRLVDFKELLQEYRRMNLHSVQEETSLLSWIFGGGGGSQETMKKDIADPSKKITLEIRSDASGIHTSRIHKNGHIRNIRATKKGKVGSTSGSSTTGSNSGIDSSKGSDSTSVVSAKTDGGLNSTPMSKPKPRKRKYPRFWMSDENCTQCGECGVPFHAFRRKHHCRLCGRVFCQSCCEKRIPGAPFKMDGMVRVCVLCSKLRVDRRLLGIAVAFTMDHLYFPRLNPAALFQHLSQRCSVNCALPMSLTPMQMAKFEHRLATHTHRTSVPQLSVSPESLFLSSKGLRPSSSSMSASGSSISLSSDVERSGLLASHEDDDAVATSAQRGSLDGSSSVTTADAITSAIAATADLIPVQMPITVSVQLSSLDLCQFVISDMDGYLARIPNLNGTDADSSPAPTIEADSGGVSSSTMMIPRELLIDSLPALYRAHLRHVIHGLCEQHDLSDIPQWSDVIYKLAIRGVLEIRPDSVANDFNDIRHYVKVKRVAGGSMSECKFINGLMFRKNLAHRKMSPRILNPKVLLFDCDFAYHRMNSKITSFDILLNQEQEYLEMIVDKCRELKPDIVAVSGRCSRSVQSFMCRKGIQLIQNVSASIMQRLSRCLKCPVITSVDHVNLLLNCVDDSGGPAVSTVHAGMFGGLPKYSTFVVEDPAFSMRSDGGGVGANGSGGSGGGGGGVSVVDPNLSAGPQQSNHGAATMHSSADSRLTDALIGTVLGTCDEFTVQYCKEDPKGTKGRRMPLIVFSGCHNSNHGTIVLRGGTKKKLKSVRNVMRLSLHCAYASLLELSFLRDCSVAGFYATLGFEYPRLMKHRQRPTVHDHGHDQDADDNDDEDDSVMSDSAASVAEDGAAFEDCRERDGLKQGASQLGDMDEDDGEEEGKQEEEERDDDGEESKTAEIVITPAVDSLSAMPPSKSVPESVHHPIAAHHERGEQHHHHHHHHAHHHHHHHHSLLAPKKTEPVHYSSAVSLMSKSKCFELSRHFVLVVLPSMVSLTKRYVSIQRENQKHDFLSSTPFQIHSDWRKDRESQALRKWRQAKQMEHFPHLQTYPYCHHGLGSEINQLPLWDPFLTNRDNPYICQTLIVSHCRVNKTDSILCVKPKLKLIDFYTSLDMSMSSWLFNTMVSSKYHSCPANHESEELDSQSGSDYWSRVCHESSVNHTLSYSHNDGVVLVELTTLKHYSEQFALPLMDDSLAYTAAGDITVSGFGANSAVSSPLRSSAAAAMSSEMESGMHLNVGHSSLGMDHGSSPAMKGITAEQSSRSVALGSSSLGMKKRSNVHSSSMGMSVNGMQHSQFRPTIINDEYLLFEPRTLNRCLSEYVRALQMRHQHMVPMPMIGFFNPKEFIKAHEKAGVYLDSHHHHPSASSSSSSSFSLMNGITRSQSAMQPSTKPSSSITNGISASVSDDMDDDSPTLKASSLTANQMQDLLNNHAENEAKSQCESILSLPPTQPQTMSYDKPIYCWSYCNKCRRQVTPVRMMSKRTRDFSFGRFLEMTFYRHPFICDPREILASSPLKKSPKNMNKQHMNSGCTHEIMTSHIKCFRIENMIAQVKYKVQRPWKITTCREIRVNWRLQLDYYALELSIVDLVVKYALSVLQEKLAALSDVFGEDESIAHSSSSTTNNTPVFGTPPITSVPVSSSTAAPSASDLGSTSAAVTVTVAAADHHTESLDALSKASVAASASASASQSSSSLDDVSTVPVIAESLMTGPPSKVSPLIRTSSSHGDGFHSDHSRSALSSSSAMTAPSATSSAAASSMIAVDSSSGGIISSDYFQAPVTESIGGASVKPLNREAVHPYLRQLRKKTQRLRTSIESELDRVISQLHSFKVWLFDINVKYIKVGSIGGNLTELSENLDLINKLNQIRFDLWRNNTEWNETIDFLSRDFPRMYGSKGEKAYQRLHREQSPTISSGWAQSEASTWLKRFGAVFASRSDGVVSGSSLSSVSKKRYHHPASSKHGSPHLAHKEHDHKLKKLIDSAGSTTAVLMSSKSRKGSSDHSLAVSAGPTVTSSTTTMIEEGSSSFATLPVDESIVEGDLLMDKVPDGMKIGDASELSPAVSSSHATLSSTDAASTMTRSNSDAKDPAALAWFEKVLSSISYNDLSNRVLQESEFLVADQRSSRTGNSTGHFRLPKCFDDRVVPIYKDEPSSLIAHALSSLDYACQINDISATDVRSSRDSGIPSVTELTARVKENIMRRTQATIEELALRKKARLTSSKMDDSSKGVSGSGSGGTSGGGISGVGSKKDRSLGVEMPRDWTVTDELDLNDLLSHVHGVPQISKLGYLKDREEYRVLLQQTRKRMMLASQQEYAKASGIDRDLLSASVSAASIKAALSEGKKAKAAASAAASPSVSKSSSSSMMKRDRDKRRVYDADPTGSGLIQPTADDGSGMTHFRRLTSGDERSVSKKGSAVSSSGGSESKPRKVASTIKKRLEREMGIGVSVADHHHHHHHPDSKLTSTSILPQSNSSSSLSGVSPSLTVGSSSSTLGKLTPNAPDVLKLKFVHMNGNNDVTTSFSCHIYHPRQFKALRSRVFRKDCSSEHLFIESLSRCQPFFAEGGKKGSFAKTLDNRFVLKFVLQNEFRMFTENLDSYFEHLSNIQFRNFPSLLVTILGCYQLSWKTLNAKGKKIGDMNANQPPAYVIVMPHLWYDKEVECIFDLKGALKGRYIDIKGSGKRRKESAEDSPPPPTALSSTVLPLSSDDVHSSVIGESGVSAAAAAASASSAMSSSSDDLASSAMDLRKHTDRSPKGEQSEKNGIVTPVPSSVVTTPIVSDMTSLSKDHTTGVIGGPSSDHSHYHRSADELGTDGSSGMRIPPEKDSVGLWHGTESSADVLGGATPATSKSKGKGSPKKSIVLLDQNFLEYFGGFPLPLDDAGKANLHKSVHNDTLFLNKSSVVDYSLLVGLDENRHELVLGIIDYMRQFDWIKKMEYHLKNQAVTEARAIIPPPAYKTRFRDCMDRYFMAVPDRRTKRPTKPRNIPVRQALDDIELRVVPDSHAPLYYHDSTVVSGSVPP